MRNPRFSSCIVLLADGARADLFQDLYTRGDLPQIREALPTLRAGITSFPSTTGPAYLPYLVGCAPGTCNVPGIRWFDKGAYGRGRPKFARYRSYVGIETFLMNRDLAPERKTLFELLSPSVSIFSTINRGVGWRGNRTKFSRIWYWYYAHLTDHWGLVDEAAGRKTVAALESSPRFLFAVLPAVDECAHLSSPFHPLSIDAYRGIDRTVGRIVRRLKELGRWEETLLWIVSDHGLSETGTHLGLNRLLESTGLRVFYYPKILFRGEVDAASMVSGNGMAHLYFKNGHGWEGRVPWEELAARPDRILERLLERPEIDLLAGTAGDGVVVVRSRRGEARISRGNGDEILYEVNRADPFGYGPIPSRMTDRALLGKTADTDYPDAPAQLLQIFRSPRTGDLVLSAAPGYDLRRRFEIPEHKSSHGSLHRDQMRVPIATNAALPDRPIRSVDVFPTVLDLMGETVPPDLDGRSLI